MRWVGWTGSAMHGLCWGGVCCYGLSYVIPRRLRFYRRGCTDSLTRVNPKAKGHLPSTAAHLLVVSVLNGEM